MLRSRNKYHNKADQLAERRNYLFRKAQTAKENGDTDTCRRYVQMALKVGTRTDPDEADISSIVKKIRSKKEDSDSNDTEQSMRTSVESIESKMLSSSGEFGNRSKLNKQRSYQDDVQRSNQQYDSFTVGYRRNSTSNGYDGKSLRSDNYHPRNPSQRSLYMRSF